MIFNEIYSVYYKTVAKIIERALCEDLDRKSLGQIIRENAFSESSINIIGALKDEKWPLITEDYKTVLVNRPDLPVTELEKRWLKTLYSDPRMKLFSLPENSLTDVSPLYPPETFVYFDKYEDGDPFSDERYIENFKAVLSAIKEKQDVLICYSDKGGKQHCIECTPTALEYSQKDDKFRICAVKDGSFILINMGRVESVCTLGKSSLEVMPERDKKMVTVEIEDRNNALERAMIHFSYLEKETFKICDDRYRMMLRYYSDEEAEVILQILAFGTNMTVTDDGPIKEKIRNKIRKQKKL